MNPNTFRTHLKKYFNIMNHDDAPTANELDSLSAATLNTLYEKSAKKARNLTTRSHRGGRRGGTRRRKKRGGKPTIMGNYRYRSGSPFIRRRVWTKERVPRMWKYSHTVSPSVRLGEPK